MALSKERKGEIAYVFMKDMMRRNGHLETASEFKESVKNQSKELGLETKEVSEFVESMMREVLEEMFS